jgi:3-oxoacyl-[acyl-carrier protein] reductase
MFDKSKPEHIAPLVVYLCTDEASNVNWRNFFIGGGSISLYSEPAIIATITRG